MRERNQAIGHARSNDLIMLGVYIPNCEPDGSFAPVQCLNASRFCWCVDGDGKEIQGTRARSRQPKCPTRSTGDVATRSKSSFKLDEHCLQSVINYFRGYRCHIV